jgi:hypothetical protein
LQPDVVVLDCQLSDIEEARRGAGDALAGS